MRVLLVSQEFPPETGWGGIGTYLGVIAPALARAGAEVHVLSVVEGQERSSRELRGVVVHRTPLPVPRGGGRVLRAPLAWRRLWGAIAVAREQRALGLDFDICESPEWGAEGLMLALRRRLPLAVRLHSGASQVLPYLGPLSRDRKLVIRMEEALIRRADMVTGTRAQTSTVCPALGVDAQRVRTITYPVAPLPRLPATEEPRALFAGRFEARKAPDVLVRAIPRLVEQVPGAKVVLLGIDATEGGSYLRGLRRLISELGVSDAVEIAERWGKPAVLEEMARSSVCVVPSPWESFGYVAAEAAMSGRAVVASKVPAIEENVVDGVTGRLVPANDPTALADAMAQLLADPPLARRMGEAGAKLIAEQCDPDRVAARTLDAYEAAIAGHQRKVRA